MSDLKKIDLKQVTDAILKAAYGTIKTLQTAVETAEMIAKITADVIETLRENGILVEATPAGETRAITAESKIAHMACQIVLQNMATQAIEPEPELDEVELIYVSEALEEGAEEIPTKKRGKK